MANPVYVSDLEARRALSDTEATVAEALLDDAWAQIVGRVPDIQSRLDNGVLSEDVVVAVETAMVLRVLRNPNGVRQWSVDDYSETRDNTLSAGALYLSDIEADLLVGRSLAGLPRAMSVSVAGDVEPQPIWMRQL